MRFSFFQYEYSQYSPFTSLKNSLHTRRLNSSLHVHFFTNNTGVVCRSLFRGYLFLLLTKGTENHCISLVSVVICFFLSFFFSFDSIQESSLAEVDKTFFLDVIIEKFFVSPFLSRTFQSRLVQSARSRVF